jgi:hypothetical protein
MVRNFLKRHANPSLYELLKAQAEKRTITAGG